MAIQSRGQQASRRNQPAAVTRSEENRGDVIWQDRVKQMLQDAEQNLSDGALTTGYKADPKEMIALLRRAQASEWASFLQYWHHYFMASDIHSHDVQEVFKDHAKDEFEHARMFGERIQQLGGVPVDNPDEINRETISPVEYNHDLRSMMEADLIGERQTIDYYDEVIRTCGFDDNVTRAIFEHAIQEEAEHANDWATLLYAFDGSNGKEIESIHDELVQLAKSSARPAGRQVRSA
jgi:bacterioferritin